MVTLLVLHEHSSDRVSNNVQGGLWTCGSSPKLTRSHRIAMSNRETTIGEWSSIIITTTANFTSFPASDWSLTFKLFLFNNLTVT